ncbi:MAG: hypothetical protein QUU85_01925, partial [Candidatus Eisenbacteria bacterium]|nr:hypothetical protein [Candidatus Eisenbacteria bacterium]
LMIAPMVVFGKNGADDEIGAVARAGYGFTDRFDAEAKFGLFEDHTVIGADGELWVLHGERKDEGVDGSLTAGAHYIFGSGDAFDSWGIDLTPTLSGHVVPSFELVGSLDVSFENLRDVPEGVDDTFTRVHLVPGFEYRLSDEADLDGEVGIGLNDDSFTYLGLGIVFYLR